VATQALTATRPLLALVAPGAIDALRPELDAEIRAEQEKRLPLLGAAEARIGKVSARGAPGRLKS
jgi:hypothetical protein